MCVSLTACDLLGGNKGDAAAFVSLDINPSLELTLDKTTRLSAFTELTKTGKCYCTARTG